MSKSQKIVEFTTADGTQIAKLTNAELEAHGYYEFEPVVIPKAVGEELDERKAEGDSIVDYFHDVEICLPTSHDYSDPEEMIGTDEWERLHRERGEQLAKAWLYGWVPEEDEKL